MFHVLCFIIHVFSTITFYNTCFCNIEFLMQTLQPITGYDNVSRQSYLCHTFGIIYWSLRLHAYKRCERQRERPQYQHKLPLYGLFVVIEQSRYHVTCAAYNALE